MKKFKNPKFKSITFWLGIISIVFSAAGISIDELVSWKLMGNAILSILNNPVSVIAVITAVVSVWNDNSTSGIDGIVIKDKK